MVCLQMKKIGIALLVTLLMVVLATAASADYEMWIADENYLQIGLPTEKPTSAGFYSEGVYCGSNYNGQEKLVWKATATDGGPNLVMEWHNQGAAMLAMDPNVSYTTGTYHYTITANSNATTVMSKEITVHFVDDLQGLSYELVTTPIYYTPTEATLGTPVSLQNGTMKMTKGTEYMVTINVGTNQCFTDYSLLGERWDSNAGCWIYSPDSRLKDLADKQNIDIYEIRNYMAEKSGTYEDNCYVVQFESTNLAIYMPYQLIIYNEDGTIGSSDPELVNWNWVEYQADVIDYPVYAGLAFDYNRNDSGTHVWQTPCFANVYLNNAADLQSRYGGAPAWDVTVTPSGLDYHIQYSNDQNQIWCILNSEPTQNYTVIITCNWGGHTANKTFNLKVSALPSMPTGLSGLNDNITAKVGDTLTLQAEAVPAGWTLPDYAAQFFCSHGIGRFANNDYWNGASVSCNVATAGTFTDEVGLSFGPLYVTKPVVFALADQNGVVPARRLETDRTVTWYTGLTEDYSDDGKPYAENAFGQMWMAWDVHDYSDTNVSWDLIHVDGPDNFVLFYEPYGQQFGQDWMERFFCAYVKPKSSTLPAGTSTYTMRATYKGTDYEGTLTIHTVDKTNLPTGVSCRIFENDNGSIGKEIRYADGAFALEENRSYFIYGGFVGGDIAISKQWLNSWFNDGITREDRLTNDPDAANGFLRSNTEVFTTGTAGIYRGGVNLSEEDTNLVSSRIFAIRVGNATANLKLEIQEPEQNVYVGLDQYGGGLGTDSIGVWGEKGRFEVYFEGFEALESLYGGEPFWTIERKDGQEVSAGSWDQYNWDNKGYLCVELADIPEQVGDVTYTITCEWDNLKDSIDWTVHYRELNTVPTGHDYPEVIETTTAAKVQIGEKLVIEPHVEPAGATIPGYDYSVHVFDPQFDEFAELDENASTSTRKVYTLKEAGVYSATILLCADTVTIGKEVIFRVADANGDVPAAVPRIASGMDMEKNYWLVPGAAPGADGFGKLLADNYLDSLYIGNETACRHELSGDPIWSVESSVSDYIGMRAESDGWNELYLKKMPAGAQDMTFHITCQWDGQESTAAYTVHFKEAPKGLPSAVSRWPADPVFMLRSGQRFEYGVEFANFEQIEGTGAWQDLSGSLRNAVDGDEVADTPGVYEGYMETGFDNVVWREKLTLVITEADGTMKASDYIPFGTVQKLPANLTVIESEAFAGTRMTEVEIPAGVTGIGAGAFEDTGLIGIYTNNNQTAIDYAVNNGFAAIVD